MTHTRLKPCPACGGRGVFRTDGTRDCVWLVIYIECDDCGFCGPQFNEESTPNPEGRAINAWNNQPHIDKLTREHKEREAALKRQIREEQARLRCLALFLDREASCKSVGEGGCGCLCCRAIAYSHAHYAAEMERGA